MRKSLLFALVTAAFVAVTAEAQEGKEQGEKHMTGLLKEAQTVVLTNKGGKRIILRGLLNPADLWKRQGFEKVPKGGTCTLPRNAIVLLVEEMPPDTAHVRYIGTGFAKGRCPFGTTFYMSHPDWLKAVAAFRNKLPDALK